LRESALPRRTSHAKAQSRKGKRKVKTLLRDRTLFVYGINNKKLVALLMRDQQNINAVSSRVQPQLHVR